VTRGERIALWLSARIPQPLLAAPERVLINVACVLIGAAALVAERPGSLLQVWPWWVAAEWAVIMASGGLAVLVGYWMRQSSQWALWVSLERVGYLAILLAAALYGVGVIVVFGWSGFFSGAIYLGIAAAKLIRLITSTAARAHLLQEPGEHEGAR